MTIAEPPLWRMAARGGGWLAFGLVRAANRRGIAGWYNFPWPRQAPCR